MSLPSIKLTHLNEHTEPLSVFAGKVLLIVNVASKCGLTPQYEALEKIYKTYHDQGFEILGFPCNDFAGQEPGDADDISAFCSLNYGVTFPIFAKIEINTANRHPIYRWLIEALPKAIEKTDGHLKPLLTQHALLPTNESDVMWNFEKFIVDRTGKVVARFAPDFTPDSEEVTAAIEAELAK